MFGFIFSTEETSTVNLYQTKYISLLWTRTICIPIDLLQIDLQSWKIAQYTRNQSAQTYRVRKSDIPGSNDKHSSEGKPRV